MAKKPSVKDTSATPETSGVVIASCSCKNAWQDKRYGAGKRVFNMNMRDKSKHEGRCTACGTKKTL